MPLSEASLKKIAENHPKVTSLNLSNQNLTDTDVYDLLYRLRSNQFITKLDLTNNKIGSKGAAELASNKSLRELKLYRGNLLELKDLAPFLTNFVLIYFPILGGSGKFLKQLREHINSNLMRLQNQAIPTNSVPVKNVAENLAIKLTETKVLHDQPVQQTERMTKTETDSHEDELIILKAAYVPSGETYENLKNFDDTAHIQRILFSSASKPLAPLHDIWFKNGNEVVLKHNTHTTPSKVTIVPFGLPGKRIDANGENRNISYNILFDNIIHQSYALTKEGIEPKRKMPKEALFTVANFPYDPSAPVGSPFSGKYHTPGHCIDHKDSPAQTSEWERSTYCYKFNYIPEPPNSYWGKHIRNPIVKTIRKSGKGITRGGIYVQYPYYSSAPLTTQGGYIVPSGIYFAGYSYDDQIKPFALNVSWNYDFSSYSQSKAKSKYKKAYTDFKEDINAMPFSTCFDINWSSQAIQKKVDFHYATGINYLQQLFPSRDPVRAYEHHVSYSAKLEFMNSKCKLELAIHYQLFDHFQIAKDYLKAAKAQTRELINLDTHEKLISESQLTRITDCWKSKDDDIVDFWRKIFSDQSVVNVQENVTKNPSVLHQFSNLKLNGNINDKASVQSNNAVKPKIL